ncbi:Protein RTM1 [Sphaceloma murrayae]|uniref:Protein RTM1 n=1 Tax=Sphaceloma murrayae TaxID=2082308 RepID=A0A2K1R2K0_9PEZI|nr:Protein RTM1 [Sphaceloma murrayae]
MNRLPNNLISYGPRANCTLDLCPIKASVYQYRPSLPANVILLVLFFLLGLAHLYRGIRHPSHFFTLSMLLGCLSEVLGYTGRLLLWSNPFSFPGFMIQICLVTFAPVFFCAAIYVLLSRIVVHLDVSLSRFDPRLWYWIFIPADVISLALQGAGGGMSSSSVGTDSAGVDISLAGLSFQVVTLAFFSAASMDYALRYVARHGTGGLDRRFRVFVVALATAVVLIFVRCAYRIEELREGYRSSLISNQGLFIALEGVVVVLAVVALLVAHPGPVFEGRRGEGEKVRVVVVGGSSDEETGMKGEA